MAFLIISFYAVGFFLIVQHPKSPGLWTGQSFLLPCGHGAHLSFFALDWIGS